MQVGLIGFGKMGKLLADKWLVDGHQIVLWNRSSEVLQKLRAEKSQYIVGQKLVITSSIEELFDSTIKPRVFWLMLPAGQPTNEMLQKIYDISDNGDIVIDGGNANYEETHNWYIRFKEKGIKFLGVGVSGGIYAANNGCSLMVGGHPEGYTYITPLLNSLAKPNGGHAYFGEGGAGHFLKMVHNGIEYGMMQSLGEGFGLLAKSDYKFNLMNVAWLWQRGSIIRSFLLAMVMSAFSKDPALSHIQGFVDSTGEADWTVAHAKKAGAPVDVIEKSLDFRKRSQYDTGIQQTFAAKLVAAIRHEFGGHQIKPK